MLNVMMIWEIIGDICMNEIYKERNYY